MCSVKQGGIGIIHGETARTVRQVTTKEFAWSITASQEMRERHRGNSLKEDPEKAKQFFFSADASYSTVRQANSAEVYFILPIFCPLIIFPLYCKDKFHAKVYLVSSFSY